MPNNVDISYSLKAKASAWLLMGMVLFTVVPFNLLHDHDTEERTTIQVNHVEDHDSCHHQFHIAEDQELCFLCHFAFLPNYKDQPNVLINDLLTSKSVDWNTHYSSNYTSTSLYSIRNKGSPLA